MKPDILVLCDGESGEIIVCNSNLSYEDKSSLLQTIYLDLSNAELLNDKNGEYGSKKEPYINIDQFNFEDMDRLTLKLRKQFNVIEKKWK